MRMSLGRNVNAENPEKESTTSASSGEMTGRAKSAEKALGLAGPAQ
jgi:hypothetical protein